MTEPTSPPLRRPLRTEAEALADIMVPAMLTRDELTTLMHELEGAVDDARKAQVRVYAPRNPVYPPMHPDIVREQKAAVTNRLERVTRLRDRITDIWRENR